MTNLPVWYAPVHSRLAVALSRDEFREALAGVLQEDLGGSLAGMWLHDPATDNFFDEAGGPRDPSPACRAAFAQGRAHIGDGAAYLTLSFRGEPFGILCLHGTSLSEGELDHLASLVAPRVVHMDLYEDRAAAARRSQEKLEALQEMGTLLSQLDLEVLLTKVLNLTLDVLSAEVGAILLWEGDRLTTRVEWGLPEEVILGLRRTDGTVLVAATASGGEPFQITRPADRDDLIAEGLAANIHSMLCVPLATREQNLGALVAVRAEGESTFTEEDVDVARTLTGLASVAVENAVLYREAVANERMAEQLSIASSIQKSLLPEKAPDLPGLEIAGWSLSCDETGGDYYDYLAGPDDLGLVVGDVSGHGIGSALLMASARACLRAFQETVSDLPRLFALLNAMLERDMEDDRFMTLFYGRLDRAQGTISYVNAGHDPPLLYRSREDRFEELDSTAPPVGMLEGIDFPEARVGGLVPGDILICSTDGIWEAMNTENDEFGRERLCEVIRAHRLAPAAAIIEAVYNEVKEFCGEAAQRDDLTMVVVRMTECAPES